MVETQTLTPLLEHLGELNLPLEEREIFLGALKQGVPLDRPARILENWNEVVDWIKIEAYHQKAPLQCRNFDKGDYARL